MRLKTASATSVVPSRLLASPHLDGAGGGHTRRTTSGRTGLQRPRGGDSRPQLVSGGGIRQGYKCPGFTKTGPFPLTNVRSIRPPPPPPGEDVPLHMWPRVPSSRRKIETTEKIYCGGEIRTFSLTHASHYQARQM